jgi:hypothetical protein
MAAMGSVYGQFSNMTILAAILTAHIGIICAKIFEAGIVTPSGIGAALDDMSNHQCSRQLWQILTRPSMPPHSGAHCDGGIGHSTAEHNVGSSLKARSDPSSAEIALGADWVEAPF